LQAVTATAQKLWQEAVAARWPVGVKHSDTTPLVNVACHISSVLVFIRSCHCSIAGHH